MKNTVMEIVFGHRLTDEELDKIVEWLDDNITADYSAFAHDREYDEEEANAEGEM